MKNYKVKKTTAIILLSLLAVSFCACGNGNGNNNDDSTATNRLDAIIERGYIEVVMEPYFSPYEFIDPSKTGDDKYVGVDVEIAQYIADKIGVDLRMVPLEFAAVLAGVTEGKYDLAISALAYTPLRAEAMNMSDGYYFDSNNAGYGLLIRADDADKYTDLESLSDAVFVMQSGSIQELFVTEQVTSYKELKRVSSTTDGYLMVAEGRADTAACAIANAQLYIDANPDQNLMILEGFKFVEDETTQGTRIGIGLGEDELTALVNEAIAELRASGKIDEWYEYYAEYAKGLGIE